MESKNGFPINNDDVGKGCLLRLKEIYVLMKLWHDYIAYEDVEAIVCLWEKFLLSLPDEARQVLGSQQDALGLLEEGR